MTLGSLRIPAGNSSAGIKGFLKTFTTFSGCRKSRAVRNAVEQSEVYHAWGGKGNRVFKDLKVVKVIRDVKDFNDKPPTVGRRL